jgi:hypothetical protein
MQVSQVAFDRYVVVLPSADADWRPLADPETLAETAAWLWKFGPTPLLAVVGHAGVTPSWLASWSPRQVKWSPEGTPFGAAIVLTTLEDLERFLAAGAPHTHTALMWPRVSPAKTFEALVRGGAAWKAAVDAYAGITQAGERVEVTQIADPGVTNSWA